MKILKPILPLMAAMTTLASCGTGADAPRVLVLYYSQNSTTEAVALEIKNRLGADIEKIAVVNPYDGDFDQTLERGLSEMQQGKLPELQPLKHNIADYDIIFLGYPIWFGNYALPMAALVEQQTFAGKKIVPFCTFGSGGLVNSSANLASKLPQAEVLPGYGVRTARIDAMPAELDRFLKANGYLEGDYARLEEFGPAHEAGAEESAIFDAAVADYDRIQAKATKAASRAVPGGVEYLFTAVSNTDNSEMKIYVLAEDGKAPVFTRVDM